MVMVLAMALPAMAEQEWANDTTNWQGDTHYDTTWEGAPDGSIAVAGLSQGDTVKFYKVLAYDQDAHYTIDNAAAMTTGSTDYGAMSWKLVAPFVSNTITLDDFKALLTTGISSTLAGKLAALVDDTPDHTATANTEVTSGSGNYKAEVATTAAGVTPAVTVDPGLYVAIVEPANAGWVYNPIFVANDYYMTGEENKSNIWTAVENPLSYSNGALAKKEPVQVTKTAVEPEASEPTNEAARPADSGKSAAKGDTVNFTITTTMPAFASNYTAPIFIISDTMTSGLDLVSGSVKVYEATVAEGVYTKGTELTASSSTFTLTYPGSATGAAETDPDYKVDFATSYIKGKTSPQALVIEYSAIITEDAIENVHAEDNTVSVEYSHKPDVDQEGEGKKVKDKTHHYSYTIDGNIWGSSEYKSYEVVKVGVDKNGNEITQTTLLDNGKSIGALEGAEFNLYTNEACTTKYSKGFFATDVIQLTDNNNQIVSDAGGRLTITILDDSNARVQVGLPGLDAGTYYLKEEKAPDGYIKQQAATKIEIIPTYYPEVTWTETEGTGADAYTYTIKCDDLLKSYIVKVDDVQIAEYTVNYASYVGEAPNQLPANDTVSSTDGTTNGGIVISNKGPVTTSATGTTNTEGKILNTQGAELPSTGGIGTTIFYIIGTLLVLGAGILLVTRRRMNAN